MIELIKKHKIVLAVASVVILSSSLVGYKVYASNQAEEQALIEEQAKAEAEAQALAEEQAKAEAEAQALAEEQAKAEAEAQALAEEQAKAEAEAQALAEEQTEVENTSNSSSSKSSETSSSSSNSSSNNNDGPQPGDSWELTVDYYCINGAQAQDGTDITDEVSHLQFETEEEMFTYMETNYPDCGFTYVIVYEQF